MKILVAGTIAALLTAAPAFAQYNPGFAPTQGGPYEAYGAVMPFGSPTTGQTGGVHMNAARAAAMRECNGAAAKLNEYTWGDNEFQRYRSCMAEHGQVE